MSITASDLALIDGVNSAWESERGHQRLWRWFGLSRASWLTLPRVLMHAMPEDWQDTMARLLEQFDQTFEWCDFQTYVNAKEDGKFVRLPEALCNYRHPSQSEINRYRTNGEVTTRVVSLAEHDARVDELLASNNALLERARTAERRAAEAREELVAARFEMDRRLP